MTKILWLTLRVQDLEESLLFYQDLLGLTVDRRFSPVEGTEIVFLQGDSSTQVELIHVQGEPIPASSGMSVGISVPNPAKTLERAQQDKRFVSDPMPLGPALECRFLEDPNGVTIQIVYEV